MQHTFVSRLVLHYRIKSFLSDKYIENNKILNLLGAPALHSKFRNI